MHVSIMLRQCISSFDRYMTKGAGVSQVQMDLAVASSHCLVTQHLEARETLVLAIRAPPVHGLQRRVQL